MTVLKVSRITGLNQESAQRAQNREFSETLTASLEKKVWEKVNAALSKVGLQCLCGGRFYTVTSTECSKGKAMKTLIDAYRVSKGDDWISVAIGDSSNDFDMLQSSDRPYLVQRPNGTWNEMDIPELNRVDSIGPQGWVKAIRSALIIQ